MNDSTQKSKGGRIWFNYFGWRFAEILPRLRLTWSEEGSKGFGIGWLCWWIHVWVWRK